MYLTLCNKTNKSEFKVKPLYKGTQKATRLSTTTFITE